MLAEPATARPGESGGIQVFNVIVGRCNWRQTGRWTDVTGGETNGSNATQISTVLSGVSAATGGESTLSGTQSDQSSLGNR